MLLLTCAGFGADQLVALGTRVYRISDSGAAKVEIHTTQLSAGPEGSTAPLLSPDQKWVAYIKDYNVWLRSTSSGQGFAATAVGKPYSKKFASIETYLVAFTADSQGFLYSVAPGMTECVDCEDRGDWLERKADYGRFLYSIVNRSSKKVMVPEKVYPFGFIDNSRMLVSVAVDRGEQLAVFDLNSGTTKSIGPKYTYQSQCELSRDRKRAICAPSTQSTSRIVEYDLASGSENPLTPPGAFAELQRPSYSRSGIHRSWTQRLPTPKQSQVRNAIVVDGQRRFTCPGNASMSDYAWVDDERLAVRCGDDLIVIDRNGNTLSKQNVGPDIPLNKSEQKK